jgi:hypothetical protein
VKIFKPIVADDFEWINTLNDSDYDVFLSLDGKPRSDTWVPIKVRRVRADKRHGKKPSDFPWLGGPLIMRQKAVDALGDMLKAHGEILPLEDYDGAELFVFNAHVIDALDEAKSKLTWFPGKNKIMSIEAEAFLPEPIQDVDVFRLPLRSSATYLSERFVNRIKEAGLVGLDFNEVWPDKKSS